MHSIKSSAFKLVAIDGKARVGQLSTNHKELETPGMLIYTRRGGVLNLTSDLLDMLKPEARALQVDVTHL